MDTVVLGLVIGFTTFFYLLVLGVAGLIYYLCVTRTGKGAISPEKAASGLPKAPPPDSPGDHHTGTLGTSTLRSSAELAHPLDVSMIQSIGTEEELGYLSIARMRAFDEIQDPDDNHTPGAMGNGNMEPYIAEEDGEPIYSKPDLSKKPLRVSVNNGDGERKENGDLGQNGGSMSRGGSDVIARDRLPSSPQSPVPPALPPRPASLLDDTM